MSQFFHENILKIKMSPILSWCQYDKILSAKRSPTNGGVFSFAQKFQMSNYYTGQNESDSEYSCSNKV